MRTRTLLTASVLVAMTASCGLPTNAGVHVVRRILTDQPADDSDIARIAPGPADGATPEQIVRGFFGAESNDDEQHLVARQFLEKPDAWDASLGTEVYDEEPLGVTVTPTKDPHTMRAVVTFNRSGHIDADGSYQQDVGELSETLTLHQVDEQWRLAAVPNGLQLSSRDVARSFVSTTVWFLSRDNTHPRLVPDPRLLQTTSVGLPSSLVRALMGGPSQRIAPAVRTAVPSGTQLSGSAVLLGGEVAVDLSSPAATLQGNQRELMLAQLAETMNQVTGAQRLRVTSGGRGLSGGDPEVGRITDLVSVLDPTGDDAPAVSPTAYGIVKGSLVSLGEDPNHPAAWNRVTSLLRIVGDPDSHRVAALQSDSGATSVLLGSLTDRPTQVLTAGAWDAIGMTPDGRVLAHRGGFDPGLVLADSRGVTPVGLPDDVPASSVTALAVARDGVHVALAMRSGKTRVLRVMALVQGASPQLIALGPPVANVNDVTDVGWDAATHLLAIATSDAGAVHPFDVLIDGSDILPLPSAGLPSQPVTISGWPGSRVLVADHTAHAWSLGSGWSPIGSAADVTYA